jgi:hypothetical protein
MARYLAKLDENNIVIGLVKIGGVECCDADGSINEEKAIAYQQSIDKEGHKNFALGCKDGTIRANPPEIGGHYDNGKKVFIRKKPHPIAVLNENHKWEMPDFIPASKEGMFSSDGSSLLPDEEEKEEE